MVALLPPGRLWRRSELLRQLLLGSAAESARVDGRAEDLLRESDPRNAVELLPEYEQQLEIDAAATTPERQARVTAGMTRTQGYRPADIRTALAPLLGQLADDVVVMERTTAFAASVGDAREVFRFFVYRDPFSPGAYYLAAAQDALDEIKASHTIGHVIESVAALCDDPYSLCDRDVLGS